jgi:hypothetical protein
MTAHLRLRGRPDVEVDGALLGAAIRRKGWVLLAVLVLAADHPQCRSGLAELLFADAEEPMRNSETGAPTGSR